jgi:hypothetical protein
MFEVINVEEIASFNLGIAQVYRQGPVAKFEPGSPAAHFADGHRPLGGR